MTFNPEVLEVSREEREGELWEVERKVGQALASQVPLTTTIREQLHEAPGRAHGVQDPLFPCEVCPRGSVSTPARPGPLLPSPGGGQLGRGVLWTPRQGSDHASEGVW